MTIIRRKTPTAKRAPKARLEAAAFVGGERLALGGGSVVEAWRLEPGA